MIVQRACTVIPHGDEKRNPVEGSRPLADFRDTPAYVLLGDPGSGKTTAFKDEEKALGHEACKVDARDFHGLSLKEHPEWRDTTLFIDGLDEVRAGATDACTPFDKIRSRLERLGRPRFRLSCREADWLGENDWKRLAAVSPDSKVTVLRLDPLGEADILRILSAQEGIEDPQLFIDNARERKIDGLLQNPLTLEFLATVIARSERWPDSRLQTFEQACTYLIREHNRDHIVASQLADTRQMLDAAGRLCAVQLISGIEGYTQVTGDPDSDFPAVAKIEYDNPDALQSVLSTKLFRAESGSLNRFGPVHRHVAEYLGGRYLARLIEDGLPARRILSLITGEDGIVVTVLRGLSAWIAAHCKGARSVLIEQDPVGVGLYGDIRGFALEEKEALLKALNREVSRLGSIEIAPAFGPLATPDMEPALRNVLRDRNRETGHQTYVDFVLRLLREGSAIPGLSDLLLDIVRDETRWPGINVLALDASLLCDDKGTKALKSLLREVDAGLVSDPDNEILGTLLWRLYPEEITPSVVWKYLFENATTNIVGRYLRFWEYDLIENSSNAQVAELLDKLKLRLAELDIEPARAGLPYSFPLKLLYRGLKVQGDQLDIDSLYDWLDAGLSCSHNRDEIVDDIRIWIEERPELQKEIILEGLKRCPESDEFRYHAMNVKERLYGAVPPSNVGRWYLEQAVLNAQLKPQVAKHLLELAWVCHSQHTGNEGLSLEDLEKYTGKCELLRSRLAVLRAPDTISRGDLVADRDRYGERYIDQTRRRNEEWLDHFRANEEALRENRAAPALLHKIAEVYFGNFFNFSAENAIGSIEKHFRGEIGLINAALRGLRVSVEREDIPGLIEILDLRKKGRKHYLEWPFLAGLAEAERTTAAETLLSDENRICSAVAFYYCTPHGEYRPDWYARLLEMCPDIVADVQVRFARSELRSGRHSICKLWEFAHDPSHAEVARLASIRLLRSFPTRCKTEQIVAFDYLLWSALRYADRSVFRELIESKLSRKSMNDAQRVHWLSAAVVVSPATYVNPLMDFVQGRENRIRYMVGFFPFVSSDAGLSLTNIELDVAVLEVLVLLVGAFYGPDQTWYEESDNEEGVLVEPEMQAALLVDILIRRLAGRSDNDASAALNRLLGDPTLSAWHDRLSRARDSQCVIQRDASFRHPEPERVCRTLNGGSPANAADLAGLLVDRMDEIGRTIRDGNTSDWRQYWEKPADEDRRKPKHEELCRDAFLSDLKYRSTPLVIDAQPEGRYADDKRADIRAYFEGFNVPVEIKRNNHPDLWTAIRTQLIAKYTREPGTAGQGIYLVFWFGKAFTRRTPSGSRPDVPDELREQLTATLSDEEARRISVVVIDVSGEKPDLG
ncbi:MAG: hypothetical protein OXU79_08665 [Gemmatimonadota bacterium]|nr:hypothetical protein [Gemmatimonadota bacterium]